MKRASLSIFLYVREVQMAARYYLCTVEMKGDMIVKGSATEGMRDKQKSRADYLIKARS